MMKFLATERNLVWVSVSFLAWAAVGAETEREKFQATSEYALRLGDETIADPGPSSQQASAVSAGGPDRRGELVRSGQFEARLKVTDSAGQQGQMIHVIQALTLDQYLSLFSSRQ